MSNVYEIQKGVPLPSREGKGLCATIRLMACGDSITVPSDRHLSVHTSARSVGAKVRTRSNGDGTVTVWRIDPTSHAISQPTSAQPRITPAQGGYYIDTDYAPHVFVPDPSTLDEFGRPSLPAIAKRKAQAPHSSAVDSTLATLDIFS